MLRDDLMAVVNRYRDRVEARVCERDGGRFDISLEVGDVSIGCIQLDDGGVGRPAFMVYRGVGPEPMGMDRQGELVPLPSVDQREPVVPGQLPGESYMEAQDRRARDLMGGKP